tara:strand:+ start:353 stop:919 length:567 start_codon:yes stop_codon:yes gene_type:complete
MIKIGITGSISSGKSTASKFLSGKKYPLFSADKSVVNLYKKSFFKRKLIKKFNLDKNKNIKNQIKKLIVHDKKTIKELEKIVHPLVRKEMINFSKNKNFCKLVFFEVPLLVENKLSNFFDIVVFVNTHKEIRVKRFIKNGGNQKVFLILNKRQLSPSKKAQVSHHVINNNKSLKHLKNSVKNILNLYE